MFTTSTCSLGVSDARPSAEPGETVRTGPWGSSPGGAWAAVVGTFRPLFRIAPKEASMESHVGSAVVAQLELEWPLLARRELAVALARWRRRQPALRRFQRTEDLLAFLHGAAAPESDAPLVALLVLAGDDRDAGRFVLQAILPALKAQARRLATHATARDELWELLLFHAWEAICTYPVTRRRRVAANLVLQVLHDTSRELRRGSHIEIRAAKPPTPTTRAHARSARQVVSGPPPRRLVRAAVMAGVIRRRDAALILTTRLRNAELHRLAHHSGVSYEALLKRRQRAERALRMWPPLRANVRNRTPGVLTSPALIGSRTSTHPSRPRRCTRSRSESKEDS
jgi:hypothetical protein